MDIPRYVVLPRALHQMPSSSLVQQDTAPKVSPDNSESSPRPPRAQQQSYANEIERQNVIRWWSNPCVRCITFVERQRNYPRGDTTIVASSSRAGQHNHNGLEAVGACRRKRKEISEHERTEAAMPRSPRSPRSPVLPIVISFAIDFIYQINVDYHCQRYLVQRPAVLK